MDAPSKQADEIFCPECARPIKRDNGICSNCETEIKKILDKASSVKVDYGIGDIGPAGGLIFYINPNYKTDSWRYFEAAPSDLPSINNDCGWIQWDFRGYGNHPFISATQTAIGTGKSNTQKIVATQGNGNYAAKLCDDLALNGYNDWYMPSKDELNLMYENLYLNGLGSFASICYWSSSGYDTGIAWKVDFYNGNHYYDVGVSSGRVRPIRAF